MKLISTSVMTEDALSSNGRDGVPAETLRSISTPDRVESRLGTLEFRDGAPTKATAELLYDHLDFVHAMEAFINAFPGASLAAIRQGFLNIGPTAPDGKETNWLQTIPGKGWFTVLRFYNPLPSFFDKIWRPSEIEPT
jgi:hypothetical protein